MKIFELEEFSLRVTGTIKVFQNDLKTEESEREITFERNLFARHGSKFDHQQT